MRKMFEGKMRVRNLAQLQVVPRICQMEKGTKMKYCVAWVIDPEICKGCYAEPQKYVCTKKDRRLVKE